MKKRLFIFLVMVVMLCSIFAISASARAIDYNDTFELKDTSSITHYERHYYDASNHHKRAYTDSITVSFIDESGAPITNVPLWEYDEDEGKYYSLVWYISAWQFTKEDAKVTISEVEYTYDKYTSAVYTLKSIRAVDIRYDHSYTESRSFSTSTVGYDYTLKIEKPLWGMFIDTNNTPNDNTDDYVLQASRGIGRDTSDYNYIGWDAQFEATGNKIVVANFRDCDFDADCTGNYGTKNTWSLATNLQCLWYPDTFKYMCGGIGPVWEIDLGDGIEVINCQILRDNKKVESIVFPNSLLYIANESFRGSSLKNIVIGEGLLYASTNVALWKNGNYENMYLSKNILTTFKGYLTKHDGNGSSILGHGSSANIYFDGNLEQATALMERMIAENSSFSEKITLVDYKDTTERGALKNAVIFYNYNRCDAFYYGEHVIVDDKNCTTTDNCTRECGVDVPKGNASHDNAETLTYANGFDKAGIFCIACQNDGCEVKTEETKNPIFTAKGYSTNDTKNSLNGGFTVDPKALEFYTEKNGALVYGIVIANANSFGGKSFFDENNEVNSEKSLKVEIDTQYSMFDCEINFGTVDASALELVICAYVIDGDGVSFIQYDSGNDVSADAISGGSFKSITLEAIIALVPSVSKEN